MLLRRSLLSAFHFRRHILTEEYQTRIVTISRTYSRQTNMANVEIPGRALHYVLKIGNRGKNAFFFRDILGMKVLRHEEFKEGCEAQCNGPYDNRWSKTMIGYGPESTHFVIELTYNYGVKSYELGNDFGGITIKSKEVLERARSENYPVSEEEGQHVLTSPDGYKFFIIEEPQPQDADPVLNVTLHSSDLARSKHYWNELLKMNIVDESSDIITLSYGQNQAALRLKQLTEPLNRAKAYGRIAFAVPLNVQPTIDAIIKEANGTILTPLITLDTPGKATVRVIILADPDGHEICFVDEEGFSELSQVEEKGDQNLTKYITKDPFQDKE
ncbi:glyoxalase domain-containing protein 4-like isoform X1 [Rhagoletis pomonella]|uniref:glyoxalase domain-containing protein 4-like isoform X1 n=2 Tax=Rhagoletis pomonella TaxID=28610 RepID=UPI00177E8FCB|nr:glyoxalase domain-containing protein 4-like isoform X1 [Rhagoletis pomonella]XP_036344198.1 glyoxalase domain-containing protein 4-like isoform X1 [Rhagoletis pomonella]